MNSMFLSNALGEIRDDYLYDAMGSAESGAESRQGNKRRFLSAAWQKALAVVACLVILVGVCAATDVFHLRSRMPGTESPTDDYPQTRIYSNPYSNPNISSFSPKPMPSQRIKLETFSFYKKGNAVIVYADMGDDYTYRQKNGQTPTYDTYGVNGYPVFLVYEIDDENSGSHLVYRDSDVGFCGIKEDSRLMINGEAGPIYEKRFSKEDLASLDLFANATDGYRTQEELLQYHRETVSLDVSRLKPGDHGSVAFLFGWYFEHDGPYVSDKTKPSIAGYFRELSYYVGEDGVGLSFNSWVDAMNTLQEDTQPHRDVADAMDRQGWAVDSGVTYGSFRGCRIVFSPGQLCVVTEREVAGYAFEYSSFFVIYAVREDDGQVYDLREAYEDGLLTEQDVAEIWQTHRAYVEEGRLPGVG